MAIRIAKTKQRSPMTETVPSGVGPQDLPVMTWPVEQWLQFQVEFFRATAPSLTDWINRRFEGFNAALRATERLAACRDMSEALSVHAEWLEGAIGRLDLDSRGIIQHALTASQCAFGATREIAQVTTDISARGAEWIVQRGSETEPPLPEINPAPNGQAPPRGAEEVWRRD